MRRLHVAAALAAALIAGNVPNSAAAIDPIEELQRQAADPIGEMRRQALELKGERYTAAALRKIFTERQPGDAVMSRTEAILWVIKVCDVMVADGTLDAAAQAGVCGPVRQMAAEIRAEAERRAAQPHNDPASISVCPPPRRMTPRDGCQ
jgi:hypothetical protein